MDYKTVATTVSVRSHMCQMKNQVTNEKKTTDAWSALVRGLDIEQSLRGRPHCQARL